MAESVREYTFRKWPVSKNFVYDVNRETGQIENLRCIVCSNQWEAIQAEAKRRNFKGVVLNSVKQYIEGVKFIHRSNVHRHCKPGSLHEFAENLSRPCASTCSTESISTPTNQPNTDAVLPSRIKNSASRVLDKYKNRRTYYPKLKHKTQNTPDNQSRLELFEALDTFLKDRVINTTTTSTTAHEKNGNNDTNDEETLGEKGSEDMSYVACGSGKRRRVDKEYLLHTLLLTLKQTTECSTPAPVQVEETADTVFGKLISQQMSAIPECFKKEVLKLKLQQLIVETKYEAELSHPEFSPSMPSWPVSNPCTPKTETQQVIPNLYHPSNMSNGQDHGPVGS